jgi:hypothetical protein
VRNLPGAERDVPTILLVLVAPAAAQLDSGTVCRLHHRAGSGAILAAACPRR